MVRRDLSKREKHLLQLMGQQPNLTNEELCRIIGYKYTEYVSTLQKKLRKMGYFNGPLMYSDLGKIFQNRVTRVHAFIMFDTSYNYVRSLIQEIDCWLTFYPLEEGIFRKYMISFVNTDIKRLKDIFDYLKDQEAIRYYHLFEQKYNWEVINPTFLRDNEEAPIKPDFDHLSRETAVPDLQYSPFVNITLDKTSQVLVERLWIEHGGYDLKKIVRKEMDYRKMRRAELKEMLRNEKKEKKKKEIKFKLRDLEEKLSLRDFRKAYQFLMDHGVLEKVYYIYPFPLSRCSTFWLFVKCKSIEATKRVMFNFGRNVRIFTRVSLVQSMETGEWFGSIFATGDPFLGIELIAALDRCSEIEDRKLFPVRSFPPVHFAGQAISLEGYYNRQTRTLHYPYDTFFERVKQKLEES